MRELGNKLENFEIYRYLQDMNKENASKLWKMIQEAGDYLLC